MRLDSQRSRKFSWEEIDDTFSAENIAKMLIKKCLNTLYPRKSHDMVPNLLEFEVFIKYMEYYEYLQAYFESKSFTRSKRAAISSQGSNSAHDSTLSASSIYLSHSSSNATLLNDNVLSTSPSENATNDGHSGLSAIFNKPKANASILGSSSLKVKSAAYTLGNQSLMDQLEKQSEFLFLNKKQNYHKKLTI